MSNYRHKRHRSRSHSSVHKRESQQNRSKDYDRRVDSYERNHHPIESNRQYDYRHASDLTVSIDKVLNNPEEYPPVIQALVREVLLERKKRQLTEEKMNIREHDYVILHAQHEQTINSLGLLKHDFDQCRLDLKNSCLEMNELRHHNHQLRTHIEQLLNDGRPQIYTNEEIFFAKRQRRY